jgi:glucosamine 6-phosphate synthetase-like amidotransferase/phosphosugar isomerase protein
VEKFIAVPHAVDCLQGILTVIPMQLLSFHIAVLRGYDVSCTTLLLVCTNFLLAPWIRDSDF